MSEVKLNVIDSQQIIYGTIHGSIADRAVAALSTEPETIAELEAAMRRFMKLDPDESLFGCFQQFSHIDDRPWDAGIVIIDLVARIVATESTYSAPGHKGYVDYHDGDCATDFHIAYRLSDDWLFVSSIPEYEGIWEERRTKRLTVPPLDARVILYGEPFLAFIVQNVRLLDTRSVDVQQTSDVRQILVCRDSPNTQSQEYPDIQQALSGNQNHLTDAVIDIHRRWLMTPRDDLKGQSPREVLFAKRELIDFDLNSRQMQWSYLLEEPPSLSRDSFAYRFAGFGTNEWVMYYDLVRFVIWEAVDRITGVQSADSLKLLHSRDRPSSFDDALSFTPGFSVGLGPTERSKTVLTVSNEQSVMHAEKFDAGSNDGGLVTSDRDMEQVARLDDEALLAHLEELKRWWLTELKPDLNGYVPADVIDNERRRRPEAMTGRSMVIDENCPCCKMMGDESEAGLGIYFCLFDGCNMEDQFAFSWCATPEEWEKEQRKLKERLSSAPS